MKWSSNWDVFLTALLFLIAVCASLTLAFDVPAVLYAGENEDVWYNADPLRVLRNMHSSYGLRELLLHPLFSFFTRPVGEVLTAAGITPESAGRLMVAASGGVVAALLFLTARGMGLPLLGSTLTSAIFIVSGTFTFWWSIVETFPIGGATVSLLFFLIVTGVRSPGWWAVVSALTFSITITNWFGSVIGSYLKFGLGTTLRIMLMSLAIVFCLLLAQQALFPIMRAPGYLASTEETMSPEGSRYLGGAVQRVEQHVKKILSTYWNETRFIYLPGVSKHRRSDMSHEALSVYAKKMAAFFIYPGAVPTPVFVSICEGGAVDRSVQRIDSDFFIYGASGMLALCCWVVLFLGGLKELLQKERLTVFDKFVPSFLAFQFMLHMVYGYSPFLYSAHFVVPLIVTIAFGFRGQHKVVLQIIGLVFCVSAVVNNQQNFYSAATQLEEEFRPHDIDKEGGLAVSVTTCKYKWKPDPRSERKVGDRRSGAIGILV